jgi:hypothetical protein
LRPFGGGSLDPGLIFSHAGAAKNPLIFSGYVFRPFQAEQDAGFRIKYRFMTITPASTTIAGDFIEFLLWSVYCTDTPYLVMSYCGHLWSRKK